jgi:hypothetical protein
VLHEIAKFGGIAFESGQDSLWIQFEIKIVRL